MSTLTNNCCQPQLLSVNSSTGYLNISEGNAVFLGTLIKTLGITTPVIDFQLNGYIVTLTYTDASGVIQFKQIDLSALAQGGSFTTNNTDTLDLTYVGAVLSGDVNISSVAGNALITQLDGLFAPTFVETVLTANSSSTLSFTTSGTDGHTLTGAVKISANPANKIQVVTDGLLVMDMTTYISAGQNITLSGNGTSTNPYVIAASNAASTPLSVNDSSSIHFLSTGTLGYTLTGNVKISVATGNALVNNSDGLYVPQVTGGTYTDAQARLAISANAPILYNNTTGVISESQATSSTSGYLTNSDWVNFNGKIATGQSLGSTSSIPIYAGQAGTTLNFNGIRAGININMTQSGNDIIINSTASGGGTASVFSIDFIIGDGGPLTPIANSATFAPSSNPLVGKTILGFFVEGLKTAGVPRTGGALYYTFTGSNGNIVLTNGVFSADTYYSILYK